MMLLIVVLSAFFILTLALGFLAGRGVKTMKDYAIANSSLGTATLTMTLLATLIGDRCFSFPFLVFEEGIFVGVIWELSFICAFILLGLLVPHMAYFRDCFTVGDLMEKLYGKNTRILSGIISFFVSIFIFHAQIEVIGRICRIFFGGLSTEVLTFLIGINIVKYTSSGMRGVAYTNVLQFVLMVSVLSILTFILLFHVGGLKKLIYNLPQEKKVLFTFNNKIYELKRCIFWSLSPTYLFAPPVMQRMLMVKSKKQARYMFFTSMLVYSILLTLFIIIGLGGILYSKFNESSYIHHVNHLNFIFYLWSYIFKGSYLPNILIFIVAIVVMSSTGASFLHTAGLSLIHDMVSPILNKKNIEINEVRWTIFSTFLIGIISIFSSVIGIKTTRLFCVNNIYRIIFVIHLTLFPLIVGIMGVKTDKKSFIAFISGYITTVILTKGVLSLDLYTPLYISLLVGITCFFASHIYQNRGFVMIDRSQDD